MSHHVNVNPHVSIPVYTAPLVKNASQPDPLETPLESPVAASEVSEAAAPTDQNETHAQAQAAFSPTDPQVSFSAEKPAVELPPVQVEPVANDLPELQSGRAVLRGDDLKARLQLLETQANQGAEALSSRKVELEQRLTSFAEGSPQRQEIQQTLEGIDKAVAQLREVQAKLAQSEHPQNVAELQALLVNQDNGKAEEEPFKARLTYDKPDGTQATFDNLYGKRTDAGIRDYIARLVTETRTAGPHALEQTEQTEQTEQAVAMAQQETAQAVVDLSAAEQAQAAPEGEVPQEAGEASQEASVVPAAEATPEATAAQVATAQESAAASPALLKAMELLDSHGEAVAKMTAYQLKLQDMRQQGNSETLMADPANQQLLNDIQGFLQENQGLLQEFKQVYDHLAPAEKTQVDQRLIEQEMPRFFEAHPELAEVSLADGEEATLQVASLWQNSNSWDWLMPSFSQQDRVMMA